MPHTKNTERQLVDYVDASGSTLPNYPVLAEVVRQLRLAERKARKKWPILCVSGGAHIFVEVTIREW